MATVTILLTTLPRTTIEVAGIHHLITTLDTLMARHTIAGIIDF